MPVVGELRWKLRGLVLGSVFALIACVPEGPPTGTAPPVAKTAAAPPVRAKASPSPSASSSAAPAQSRPLLAAPFEDDFNRTELGAEYNALSPVWKIRDGKLCARGARNHGVWLVRRMPVNARIEFDAYAESAEGDVKVELWGDGASGATGVSYSNATSYLAILGGWKNSKQVLARLDEHGDDRQVIEIDPNSDDERARAVSVGQPYHFKIERADGRTIEWFVNGLRWFELKDADPLAGAGHEYMGFNDWDAPVCFDNLKVVPL